MYEIPDESFPFGQDGPEEPAQPSVYDQDAAAEADIFGDVDDAHLTNDESADSDDSDTEGVYPTVDDTFALMDIPRPPEHEAAGPLESLPMLETTKDELVRAAIGHAEQGTYRPAQQDGKLISVASYDRSFRTGDGSGVINIVYKPDHMAIIDGDPVFMRVIVTPELKFTGLEEEWMVQFMERPDGGVAIERHVSTVDKDEERAMMIYEAKPDRYEYDGEAYGDIEELDDGAGGHDYTKNPYYRLQRQPPSNPLPPPRPVNPDDIPGYDQDAPKLTGNYNAYHQEARELGLATMYEADARAVLRYLKEAKPFDD